MMREDLKTASRDELVKNTAIPHTTITSKRK